MSVLNKVSAAFFTFLRLINILITLHFLLLLFNAAPSLQVQKKLQVALKQFFYSANNFSLLNILIINKTFFPLHTLSRSLCVSMQYKHIIAGGRDHRGGVHGLHKMSQHPASVLLPRTLTCDASSGLALVNLWKYDNALVVGVSLGEWVLRADCICMHMNRM